MRNIVMGVSLILLMGACAPAVPNSAQEGIGFDTFGRAERERQLQQGIRPQPTTVLPPQRIANAEGADIAADTAAVLARTAPQQQGVQAGDVLAQTPELDANNPGISTEQDFGAVAAERSIEDDAARVAAAREQFRIIQPQELERQGDLGPNIIQYALSTTHSVGQQQHRRGAVFGRARAERACQQYRTADRAQEAFLEAGGPARDRLGLDPDGDGFACGWDPASFRNLVRN